jgi:hypothetical protein
VVFVLVGKNSVKAKVLTLDEFDYLPKNGMWDIWRWMNDSVSGKVVHPIPHGHCGTVREAEDYANRWLAKWPDCEFIIVKVGDGCLLFLIQSISDSTSRGDRFNAETATGIDSLWKV